MQEIYSKSTEEDTGQNTLQNITGISTWSKKVKRMEKTTIIDIFLSFPKCLTLIKQTYIFVEYLKKKKTFVW